MEVDGDGDGLAGPDGELVCDAAGWLAEAGLTACAESFEPASCRTCTAIPIASTQTAAVSWPRSRTTTCRAAGRAVGSAVAQLATGPRSGSGSTVRSCLPGGPLPVAANSIACAQASMSAAGVAAP